MLAKTPLCSEAQRCQLSSVEAQGEGKEEGNEGVRRVEDRLKKERAEGGDEEQEEVRRKDARKQKKKKSRP